MKALNIQFKKVSNEKGFTLLELMFVVGLMSIVLLGMFSVTAMCQSIFYNTGTYGQLTQNAMQSLRTVSREIGQTSPTLNPQRLNITADGNGNNVACFQMPVDWDNDGDVVTGTLNPQIEWGAYPDAGQTQNGSLNAWTCYMVTNNQLIRQMSVGGAVTSNRVLSNDILTFQVQQLNTDRLRMTLTSRALDTRGQGGAARTFTSTFTSTTLLRNAVS